MFKLVGVCAAVAVLTLSGCSSPTKMADPYITVLQTPPEVNKALMQKFKSNGNVCYEKDLALKCEMEIGDAQMSELIKIYSGVPHKFIKFISYRDKQITKVYITGWVSVINAKGKEEKITHIFTQPEHDKIKKAILENSK